MPRTGTILGLLMACGCASDSLSSITTVTDEFLQNKAAAVDVLWVIDNSESMREEQQGIGADFQAFVRNLIDSAVDYHIGVISTDVAGGGRLHYGPSSIPFIHPEIGNADAVFAENVFVGTAGARQEKPFETTALALGKGGSWAPGAPSAHSTGCGAWAFCIPRSPSASAVPSRRRRGLDRSRARRAGAATRERCRPAIPRRQPAARRAAGWSLGSTTCCRATPGRRSRRVRPRSVDRSGPRSGRRRGPRRSAPPAGTSSRLGRRRLRLRDRERT